MRFMIRNARRCLDLYVPTTHIVGYVCTHSSIYLGVSIHSMCIDGSTAGGHYATQSTTSTRNICTQNTVGLQWSKGRQQEKWDQRLSSNSGRTLELGRWSFFSCRLHPERWSPTATLTDDTSSQHVTRIYTSCSVHVSAYLHMYRIARQQPQESVHHSLHTYLAQYTT